jgi:hypothetical protein
VPGSAFTDHIGITGRCLASAWAGRWRWVGGGRPPQALVSVWSHSLPYRAVHRRPRTACPPRCGRWRPVANRGAQCSKTCEGATPSVGSNPTSTATVMSQDIEDTPNPRQGPGAENWPVTPDDGPHPIRVGDRVVTGDAQGAGIGRDQGGQDTDHRGLTGPVRTQKRQVRTLLAAAGPKMRPQPGRRQRPG